MEDNIQNVNENEQTEQNEYQQYIDTIADLKANTVPKEKYQKLEQEKQGLINALRSGEQIKVEQEKPEEAIQDLRRDLYGSPDKPLNNLEYVTKMLKLRNMVIAEGGKDPFLPNGADYQENQADIDKANYIAKVYQECIDYADGDSQLFTNELMRRVNNDSPIKNAKK